MISVWIQQLITLYSHILTNICKTIFLFIQKVASDAKLPILYLIDSIVKNIGDKYKSLFAQNIVSIFCEVFKKVTSETLQILNCLY